MVVSRGKRKQKEIATPKPTPEPPKRLKFQAQRKFAQGQGHPASTSNYLNFANSSAANSSQVTPVKENQNPPPELLPNQRPNTEDFLTFLCFRNTPVLPPALDFLNPQKQRKAQAAQKAVKTPEKKMGLTSSTSKSSETKDEATTPKKTEENGESSNSNKKPAAFPGAVRKRADKVPMMSNKFQQNDKKQKNDTKVANALKKKYAKLNKVTAKETRRTRAHPETSKNDDDDDEDDAEQEEEEKTSETPQKRKSSLHKSVSNNSLDDSTPVKKSPRTTGSLKNVKNPNKDETETSSDKIKKRRGRKVASEDENGEEAATHDDSKPEEPEKIERRQTRYASFRIPPPLKKERKKKTDSPVVMLKEKTPESTSTPPTDTKKPNKVENVKENNSKKAPADEKDEHVNKKLKKEIDFSSEDDEPLVKTGKRTPLIESDEGVSKPGRRTLHKGQPKKSNFIDEIVKKLDDDIENEKKPESAPAPTAPKVGRGRPKRKSVPDSAGDTKKLAIESKNESPIPGKGLADKKSPTPGSTKLRSPTPGSKTENESKERKKIGRARRTNVKDKVSIESIADDSESETEVRAARPSRKTKEAATIYMELIGRKLSLKELSDDDSLDSLELPNIQRMQQMEDEIKSNHDKQVELAAKNASSPVNKPSEGKTGDEPVKKKRGRKKKETPVVETTPVADEKTVEKPKILEKSFDDSDEEPLATKAKTKKEESGGKRGRKTSTPNKKDIPAEIKVPEIQQTPSPVKLSKWQERLLANSSPKSKTTSSPVAQKLFETSPTKDVLNKTDDSLKVHNRSSNAKVFSPDPKGTNKPSTSENIEIAPTSAKEKPFVRPSKVENVVATEIIDDDDDETPKPLNLAPKSLLGNLLPSKEEQNKIFGIASITLAQSSGPMDTKCHLGKCGSVHKPLGPAVLTESNLGGHLSPKDRRKSKVNMSNEQIQRWIEGIQVTPVPDDLDDIELDGPVTKMSPYPSKDFMDESSSSQKTVTKKEEKQSSPNKNPTVQASKLGMQLNKVKKEEIPTTSFNVTNVTDKNNSKELYKSPEVKKETEKETPKLVRSTPELFNAKEKEKVSPLKVSSTLTSPTLPPKITSIPDVVPKIMVPTSNNKTETTPTTVSSPILSTPLSLFTTKTTPLKSPLPKLSDTKTSITTSIVSTAVNNITTTTPTSSNVDKKPVYCPIKRTPIYKQLDATPSTPTSTSKPVVNIFGTFSAENEKSIYSFDEPDADLDGKKTKTSPSNKKGGRRSGPSSQKQQGNNVDGDFKNPTPPKNATPAVSLTLSPEESSKIAAINLTNNHEPKKEEDADSDSEGQTFYIPLSSANIAGSSKLGEMIQGVKLKLGTEGPEGPNQRVIMHAKLVTKAEMGDKSTTPMPEGITNMTEIVKALTSSKDMIGKSVPVGTVQPRFKSDEIEMKTVTVPLPTTSVPVVETPPPAGALSRINSNSSLSSARSKLTKPLIQPANPSTFPHINDSAQMVEAPIFRPTEKEFQDPIEFFERILPVAATFGICRVIPPASFKPECRISDDMRFTAYNQYIHKMLYRWGPSAKELAAIKKYLETQNISMQHPPWIGGMEVDLPRLYHTVQELGGLKEVIEKKKWPKVSEEMCIPKTAHDRVSKLDDIYCKYLLPYDTLSPSERQKLFDEVEADWAKQEAKARRNADRFRGSEDDDSNQSSSTEDEDDEDNECSMECMVKGRSMPLNQFFRIARNTMSLWFKNAEPTSQEVEAEFWRHVAVRDSHVCVNSGSIDSSGYGYGFPTPGPKGKGSPCAKHPWNLKVLTNNQGSILRSLGPVTGVTVPTIHVGMLFSACCWYRDPHGLPWIEYMHTGGSKIWYGVPDEQSNNFRTALTNLIPTHCQSKTVWLPCDTAMVPPHMLTDKGVSLCRTEQEPGQFVIIFPRAYTSSICTGYTVSESVMFASSSWLETAKADYEDMHDSCEPAMFSLEQLLFAIASDQRSSQELHAQILPMLIEVYEKEKSDRKALKDAGVVQTEKIPIGKKKIAEEFECEICRANLSISMIKVKQETNDDDEEEEETIYCMRHTLKNIQSNRLTPKNCKLVFSYSIDEIETLISKIKDRVQTQIKGKKKDGTTSQQQQSGTSGRKSNSNLYQPSSSSKYSGMPTMLK